MSLDGALVKVKRRKLKTYIRSYRGVSGNIGIFLVKAKILIRLSIKKKKRKSYLKKNLILKNKWTQK